MRKDSTTQQTFHGAIADALSSTEHSSCTIDRKLPDSAVAVGTLTPGLQQIFFLLEEKTKDLQEKQRVAAEAKRQATNAEEEREALKTVLFAGMRSTFINEIPPVVGKVGIAPNWVVFYETPEAMKANMGMHEMLSSLFNDD